MSDHSAVRHLLQRILQYKGAQYEGEEAPPPSDAVDITLDFSVDRDPVISPQDAHYVDMSEPFGIGVWRTPGRMVLRHEDTTVDLHAQAGVAEAAVPSGLLASGADRRRTSLLSYLVALSLAILLRARGWFPLHAAGLTRNGRGALLTARSGSGKSTAALSLVRNGWGYLSDDTVLLRAEDDQVNAYSFRRNFCVDPNAATHFPELDDSEWDPALSDSAKWQIDPGQVYPGQSEATCTPRLLVLPDLVDTSESHVEPVGTKLVLEQLISQGAFFLAPDSDVADRHLATLRRLIDQSHTYQLHAGRDALEEPRTLHGLLAPLLEDAPTNNAA